MKFKDHFARNMLGCLLLYICSVFLFGGIAYADPMMYTFKGKVFSIGEQDPDAFDYNEIRIGDPVTFRFIIDVDRKAEQLYEDGTKYIYNENEAGETDTLYFYTRHYSGGLMQQKNDWGLLHPEFGSSFNVGSMRNFADHWTRLTGGYNEHQVVIYRNHSKIQDWVEGTIVWGEELSTYFNAKYNEITYKLELISISLSRSH